MTMLRPENVTKRRLSRRSALRAGGLGMAATLGGARNLVSAEDATPTAMIGEEPAKDGLAVEVIELFKALPGTKARKC